MIADRHIMRENIFQKCSSHQISRIKKKKKLSQNRNKLGITADKGQVNVGCENEREGRQRRNIYIDLSNTPHCPPASRNRQCFLSFPFFFCSPKWRVWFETQPTNNASRESTLHKEAATEVVDLITREKWKEFATSTLWTVHTTAKAVRRHCCFRGEQIGATTSTHAHVCCACAWCNQCTWSTYSAPSHKSSQSLATPFLSLSFHYGRQPMSGCSTNTRFLMHINH